MGGDPRQSSYDDLPYDSRFHAATNPDRLATMAVLHGLRPPAVEHCRVLEIGCADGGNLLPMAQALPDAHFVGIDLSPRQIEAGLATLEELGLRNVQLWTMGLKELDDAAGVFDYIICHGVYSWVSPELRDKLLSVCARNLTPGGVAYVSYNCYPGWHLRGMVRELLLFHTSGLDDPLERVRQARAFLEFLARTATPREGGYARALRDEAALLAKKGDSYVFHELLEEVNHPVYFHEFVAHAAATGLRYLGPARFSIHEAHLAPEVKQALDQLGDDRLRREQYLDFVQERTFRQSLLCHQFLPFSESVLTDAVRELRVTAMARPQSPSPDPRPDAPENFLSIYGDQLTVNRPALKAALMALCERWPRSAGLDELWAEARSRLGRADGDPQSLATALLQGHVVNLVDLGTHDPKIATEPSERPRAGVVARRQAAQQTRVYSLRLRPVPLEGLDVLVLQLLDGTRDRPAIRQALADWATDGTLQVQEAGQPVRDPARARELLAASLEPSLRHLAAQALLIAD
jgi:methyltransferase-like protein/cyclopropane fatty-acyl-phospholipid synthase-like methyltransferase